MKRLDFIAVLHLSLYDREMPIPGWLYWLC